MHRHPNALLCRVLFAGLCPILCTLGIFADTPAPDACSTITIGSGLNSWERPLHTYYMTGRTQCIYLAGEIGAAGDIVALALNVLTPPPAEVTNWTIRMKHTTQASFANANLEAGGWTTVYQVASQPAGSAGWRTFTFSTPFAYDGTSNLMVDFSFRNTPYAGDSGYCASRTLGTYRTVVRSQDVTSDPLAWSGTGNAQRNFNIPQIQLTLCGGGGPPSAPTGLTTSAKTATSITWAWTRTSSNEDGFYGHNPMDTLMWTAPAGTSSHEETDLDPNTQYTRHVHAFNGAGLSGPSNVLSTYTLAVAPEISCNRTAGCPSYAVGTAFTFDNDYWFGPAGVDHFHYAWSQSPTYTFNAAEPAWSSGALQLTANQTGSWYLHVMSHNVEHNNSGIVRLGPYVIELTPRHTPGDFDEDCDVDQDDLDIMIACALGPAVPQNEPACAKARLDDDDDVDSVDFAIFQRCWSGELPADPACAD